MLNADLLFLLTRQTLEKQQPNPAYQGSYRSDTALRLLDEISGDISVPLPRNEAAVRKQKESGSLDVSVRCSLCALQSLLSMAAALPRCYHGAISKTECESLLGMKNKDGAYLIRDSETIQGAMCLCVYKQRVVYTYRLLQTHNGNYTLMAAGGIKEVFFKTLDDLIFHYKRRNQGLAIQLRHAVKRKTDLFIQPRYVPEPPHRAPEPPEPPAPRRQQRLYPEEDTEDHDYENAPQSQYVEVLPPEFRP